MSRGKKVIMGPAHWRTMARLAVEHAVGWTARGSNSTNLAHAAEMLRAADTFNGRANMLEIAGKVDEAFVEE